MANPTRSSVVLLVLALIGLSGHAKVADHERGTVLSVLAVAQGLNDIEMPNFDSNRKVEAAQASWLANHYVAINTLTELTDQRHRYIDNPLIQAALTRFHAQLERMLNNVPIKNASLFALQYHYQNALTRAIAELVPAQKLLEEEPLIHHPDIFHRSVVDDLRFLLQVMAADGSHLAIENSKAKIVLPFSTFSIRTVEGLDPEVSEDAEPLTITLKDKGVELSAASTANAIRAKQALLKHVRNVFAQIKSVLDLEEPRYVVGSILQLLRAIASLDHNSILDVVANAENEREILSKLDVLHAETTMAIKRFTLSCPAGLDAPRLR